MSHLQGQNDVIVVLDQAIYAKAVDIMTKQKKNYLNGSFPYNVRLPLCP